MPELRWERAANPSSAGRSDNRAHHVTECHDLIRFCAAHEPGLLGRFDYGPLPAEHRYGAELRFDEFHLWNRLYLVTVAVFDKPDDRIVIVQNRGDCPSAFEWCADRLTLGAVIVGPGGLALGRRESAEGIIPAGTVRIDGWKVLSVWP